MGVFMRIDIKTKSKIKDPDIKALYILDYALKLSTDRMRKANIEFILSKWANPTKPPQP